jgi:uncharacterized protein
MTSFFDVRRLKLRIGEEFQDAVEIELEPIVLAGQRYVPVPEKVQAQLTVDQASSGKVFGLRFDAALFGPCFRCLADAEIVQHLDLTEYQAADPAGDEELKTPYLVDDRLDLSAWARDGLVLSLPEQILHKPDCAGLCPECGRDLNVEPHVHDEERLDPRWAGLSALKDQLEDAS